MLLRSTRFNAIAAFVVMMISVRAFADEAQLERGQKIYEQSCASCHGAKGEGVEESYPDALIGDASIGELTKTIADTMPEEKPESCVGKEAAAVAEYIHQTFYSPAAQLRNRPPRRQLSRLTGTQLQQSIADLYERFENDTWLDENRGIEGTYINRDSFDHKQIKIKRIDDVLDFDFGDKSPGDGIDAKKYYIHWAGSLKVDHTGRYQIVLRSTCSCMMYFGHHDRELFNNHVQSEGREEFRATVNLIAGRLYPIKVEFVQRKRKTKQPPASISLSWVPPNGELEIIPKRNLIPAWMPATFALQVKLPPDDSSYGYERGTSIDRGWDESTTKSALAFAEIAADELYPRFRKRHRKENDDNRALLRRFLTEVLETAFRGKIDDSIRKTYIDSQLAESPDDAEAIKRSMLLALKSPRFLYPALDAAQSQSRRAANRLALTMYDSLPSDRWLLNLAENEKLDLEDRVRNAARTMVKDYRCDAKLRAFIYHWLDLDDLGELTKDAKRFEGFDKHMLSELRGSLDAFLDDVIATEESDFRQLLLADWTFTNERLQAFYGPGWMPTGPATEHFRRSVTMKKTRAGVLTHPLLMSKLGYHAESSPIHRGVFLIRHMLGRTLRPPNEAFTPINPDLHPELTTRQRVEMQTDEVSCQVCHSKINSLGFALEKFDAAGRFRETERDKPIDSAGQYVTKSGETVRFNSARELGEFLANSPDCHQAFVESLFEYFVKQPIAAFGPNRLEELTQRFRDDGYNIRNLVVLVATIAATEQ